MSLPDMVDECEQFRMVLKEILQAKAWDLAFKS